MSSMSDQQDGYNDVQEKPKFMNNLWSNVIQLRVSTYASIHLSSIQEGFDQMKGDPIAPKKTTKKTWELLFDPELLVEVHGVLKV